MGEEVRLKGGGGVSRAWEDSMGGRYKRSEETPVGMFRELSEYISTIRNSEGSMIQTNSTNLKCGSYVNWNGTNVEGKWLILIHQYPFFNSTSAKENIAELLGNRVNTVNHIDFYYYQITMISRYWYIDNYEVPLWNYPLHCYIYIYIYTIYIYIYTIVKNV